MFSFAMKAAFSHSVDAQCQLFQLISNGVEKVINGSFLHDYCFQIASLLRLLGPQELLAI